jgi:hypothetical protein
MFKFFSPLFLFITLQISPFLAQASHFEEIRVTFVDLSQFSLEDDDDDVQTISAVFNRLMTAEEIKGVLNVDLMMDDQVEDILVFGIKANDEHFLVMKIFDLYGRELFAHGTIPLIEGSNYRSVNLERLPSGNYFMQLEENGKEIVREFVVARKED